MKISEQWLREWVSPKMTTQELADCLTMAGLEVGGIESAAPPLAKIVVGRISAIEAHPDADRLRVCMVDVGQAAPLQIVCGASNARQGMHAPVALVGAVLPNGTKIGKTKVRGVASAGMLCAAVELGLEDHSPGLMDLGTHAKSGMAIRAFLKLDDNIIDIDLTPNRGDCLSIAGVARELSALTQVRVKPPKMPAIPASTRLTHKVVVKAKQACPRYVGRVISGVDAQAVTPLWMQERLRRCGQRCIHPVVDVLNYVMLEIGQPMHAFDLAKLKGDIVVRHAKQSECLTLLDGSETKLNTGALLIADDNGPLALAGIMGGLDSAVDDQSSDIFLESAHFAPQAIAGRARKMGMQTESSYRFERGVDASLQALAIERATKLLLEIVGGSAGPITDIRDKPSLPKRSAIKLDHNRVHRVLGIELSAKAIEQLLTRLGMGVVKSANGWRVTPPSHRFDISRACDLIEEIARVHGYNEIPSALPRAHMEVQPQSETKMEASRIVDLLVDRDYQEVITYSFVDSELESLLAPQAELLTLANPISHDMAVMRSTLWTGLLQALSYNLNRQHRRVRLFEAGRVFSRDNGTYLERQMLAGLISGSRRPSQWSVEDIKADFYDIKGDVEALIGLSGAGSQYSFRPEHHPALHPGQSASILDPSGANIGKMGCLHPKLAEKLDIPPGVCLFELDFEALKRRQVSSIRPPSRFPAIRRDLVVTVAHSLPVQTVLDAVTQAAGGGLTKLELFDVYRGKGVDSKRKSLGFGLTLQDSSRTLRDEDVDAVMDAVLAALQKKFGAQLRE